MAMVTLHLSPPELAIKFGQEDQTVWRWLSGRQRIPEWVEREVRAALEKVPA